MNGSLIKRGFGKFSPNLEILEAFVMDIKVSFLNDFASRSFDSGSRILILGSCGLAKS